MKQKTKQNELQHNKCKFLYSNGNQIFAHTAEPAHPSYIWRPRARAESAHLWPIVSILASLPVSRAKISHLSAFVPAHTIEPSLKANQCGRSSESRRCWTGARGITRSNALGPNRYDSPVSGRGCALSLKMLAGKMLVRLFEDRHASFKAQRSRVNSARMMKILRGRCDIGGLHLRAAA